jgi:hypothetical protein
MVERYGDDATQHPSFDPTAWVTAAGEPKKGRVFGFGSNMNTSPVIGSSSYGSPTSCADISSKQQIILSGDDVRQIIDESLDKYFEYKVAPFLRNEIKAAVQDRGSSIPGPSQV